MQANLTPAQLEQLRLQKIQKFKEMGLPHTAGQISDMLVENIPEASSYSSEIYESAQSSSDNSANIAMAVQTQIAEERARRSATLHSAPKDKLSALEAIKRGAKKQEFQSILKANGGGADKGYQIPEKKTSQKKEKPSQSVPVEQHNAPKNEEAQMLESMFTDSASISISQSPSSPIVNVNSDYSNIGPSFDPTYLIRKRAQESGKKYTSENSQQQVFSENVNSSNQMNQMMLTIEQLLKNQQKNYDIEMLKEIMHNIAKEVAEDVIGKVLKEYVESHKKKIAFEYANKDKNVIKIDDKYYQLRPVTIKHKV
ncbi:MAG: hypothetical protein WC466_09175 [Candidatus Izemoplasmatales bacterium]